MKIKSRIDVITNSSTEVFCFKLGGEKYKRLKEKLGPLSSLFTEIETLDDLKKLVLDPKEKWYGLEEAFFQWQQSRRGDSDFSMDDIKFDPWGNYGEIARQLEENGKTPEEIWEFFKDFYKPILGNAIYTIPEGDYCDEKFSELYDAWVDEERVRNLKEKFAPYKPGDIVCLEAEEWLKKDGYYEGPATFLLCKPSDPDDPFHVSLATCYCKTWEGWDTIDDQTRNPGFKYGVAMKSENVSLGGWDLETLRPATEPEKLHFLGQLKKAGQKINPVTYATEE